MLEKQTFVHSSAQVGNVLRVMVSIDEASPASAVNDAINREGLNVKSCTVAMQGLEDVFVAATRMKKTAA